MTEQQQQKQKHKTIHSKDSITCFKKKKLILKQANLIYIFKGQSNGYPLSR